MQSPIKRETKPTNSSMISIHCRTIEQKRDRLDMSALLSMLNSFVQELGAKQTRTNSFVDSMNQIIETFNSTMPSVLKTLEPHDFLLLVRTTMHKFLQQILRPDDHFHEQELHLFRNNILFIESFLEKTTHLSKHVGWFTESNFVQTFGQCLQQVKRLIKIDPTERLLKQITRLLKIFSDLQERLLMDAPTNAFSPLFEAVVTCLKSKSYSKVFQSLQSNTNSLTNQEKFFLIRCPHFLTSYQSPNNHQGIKTILDKMLPRYARIFDQHMKTIKVWHRPMMRAFHNLLTMLIYSEDHFAEHVNEPAFRSLINHFLTLIDERTILAQIRADSNNIESLIIDATLVILTMLVMDGEALNYIQEKKSTELFRQLTFAPRQTIVLNAYMMMAYTIDEEGIKNASGNFGQLFMNIADVLDKNIKIRERMNRDDRVNRESIDRNIMQLIETLKGLVQHDSLKNQLYKTKVLPHLLNCYYRLKGFSKQLLLEGFWTLAFNEKAARALRSDSQFLSSLEDLVQNGPKDSYRSVPLTRTASFQSIRSAQMKILNGEANQRLKTLAIGLLWLLTKEQSDVTQKSKTDQKKNLQYDLIISSCYTDRKLVDKIYQYLLKQGFRIWYDQIHFNNDAIDKLPDIIHSTGLILVCISDAFKRDNYCRTLIQYASHHHRPMLPAIVHAGCKLDGWLDSVIKSSFSLNLTTSDFNTAVNLLGKEIQHQKKKHGFQTSKLSQEPIANTHEVITSEGTRSTKVMSEQHESEPTRSSPSLQSTPETSILNEQLTSDQIVRDTFDPQRDLPSPVGRNTTANSSRIATPQQHERNGRDSVRSQSQNFTQTVITNEREDLKSIRTATPVMENNVVPDEQRSTTEPKPTSPNNRETDSHDRTASTVSSDTTLSTEKQSPSPPVRSATPQLSVTNESRQTMTPVPETTESRRPEIHITHDQDDVKSEPATINGNHLPSVVQQSVSVSSTSTLNVPNKLQSSGLLTTSNGSNSIQNNRSIFRSPIDACSTSDASFSSEESDSEEEASVIIGKPQPPMMVNAVRPIYPTVPLPPPQPRIPINNGQLQRPPGLVAPNRPPMNVSLQKPAVIVQPPPPASIQRVVPVLQPSRAPIQNPEQKMVQQRIVVETVSESDSTNGSVQSSPIQTARKLADVNTLPKVYTNRNTTRSNYRSISVNAWTNDDVLDFLFDHKLYAMMPLCELMSGSALIRLYQMSYETSNKLFDHLNKELSIRFNGLLLTSSIYTQFLAEMNKLVGSSIDALPETQLPRQKIIERVILMPSNGQTSNAVSR